LTGFFHTDSLSLPANTAGNFFMLNISAFCFLQKANCILQFAFAATALRFFLRNGWLFSVFISLFKQAHKSPNFILGSVKGFHNRLSHF